MKKLLVVGVIVLFIGLSIAPSTGNRMFNDDTTPPVTTCTLDPPEPDGDNGWYVNDVNVTLNATDDMSGVKEIKYKIGSASWYTITGDNGTFVVDCDGNDLPIEFYAIDNVGNEEIHQTITIDKDKTEPDIEPVLVEFYKENCRWYINLSCDAVDATSGMDRVEMYINDELYEINESKGPIYEFVSTWSKKLLVSTLWFHHYDSAGNKISYDLDSSCPPPYPPPSPTSSIKGLIFNREISEETVSFFALIILCSVDGIHTYKQLSFPNNYTGYIGRFLIRATFYF